MIHWNWFQADATWWLSWYLPVQDLLISAACPFNNIDPSHARWKSTSKKKFKHSLFSWKRSWRFLRCGKELEILTLLLTTPKPPCPRNNRKYVKNGGHHIKNSGQSKSQCCFYYFTVWSFHELEFHTSILQMSNDLFRT